MRKLASISSVCEVNPRIPKALREQQELPVSFLRMAAVEESGMISGVEERQLGDVLKGYTYFEEGDVLVAKITPCMENGKAAQAVALPHAVGFGSTEFHVLRPGTDIDGRYLFHMVWNPMFRQAAEKRMIGSAGQRRVPAALFKEFKIPLPPLPEQRRIAATLDKADAVRRKRKQTLDLADLFLRSAFIDLFGDPVTNPRGWSAMKLGELAEIQGGLQVTSKRRGNPIEVPYLRVANVYRGILDLGKIKTIRVTAAELDREALQESDVLIVEGHGNRDEVGRSAVWNGSIDPCVHQNHLIRARPAAGTLTPQYLSFYLNSSGGRRQMFRSGKTTSGLNTISTRNVKETRILLPPIQEQERFVRLRASTNQMIGRFEDIDGVVVELSSSLTQRAFRGELS